MSHMGTNARDIGNFSLAVSAELRGAIAKAGYSVRSFAAATDIPLSTLHKTLRGERVVDVEDLAQICSPLRVDPSEILERAERELARVSDVGAKVTALVVPQEEEDDWEAEDARGYAAKKKSSADELNNDSV